MWSEGELLKLESLPGPLLVDNMEDQVRTRFFYLRSSC
jgi:hypothetical protein